MKKIIIAVFVLFIVISNLFAQCDEFSGRGWIKKTDEFTGETTIRGMLMIDNGMLGYSKIIYADSTISYFSNIYTKVEQPIYGGKGVYLLLKNGKKISKPEGKVSVEYMSTNYYIRGFIMLTDDDLELLTDSGIEKFKLYITTGMITDTDKIKRLCNCVVNAK
jgi:hypothetical protein